MYFHCLTHTKCFLEGMGRGRRPSYAPSCSMTLIWILPLWATHWCRIKYHIFWWRKVCLICLFLWLCLCVCVCLVFSCDYPIFVFVSVCVLCCLVFSRRELSGTTVPSSSPSAIGTHVSPERRERKRQEKTRQDKTRQDKREEKGKDEHAQKHKDKNKDKHKHKHKHKHKDKTTNRKIW